MKLLADGPDIPQELLSAQERGEVLFICGAGVSKTAGLPLFKGLVVAVYEALDEKWEPHPAEREVMGRNGRLSGQYDRALRSLERRLTAAGVGQTRHLRERLRDAVRAKLQPPANHDLAAHSALLDLSRDAESTIRLVTTNFDTLFERAWPRLGRVPSFAGPAMPQPKTAGCAGVLHLHGRIKDQHLGLEETELVLTSAEFGDAYLRSGWASRYVYDLVRAYTVVLVGYKADDPPMRYMLDVLEADRERYADLQKIYAFTEIDGDEVLTRALWEAKGVVPIVHDVEGHDYGPLYRTVIEWRNYAQDPSAWRKDQLRKLFAADPRARAPAELVERVAELLRQGDASLLLAELDPPAMWLPLLRQQRIFDGGRVSPGAWIGARLNDADMIRAAVAHSPFDETLALHIEHALERRRAELGDARARAWEYLLSTKKPRGAAADELGWVRIVSRIRAGDTSYDTIRLVTGLLRPRLSVRRALPVYEEIAEPEAEESASETINSFMRLDFEPPRDVEPRRIVKAWPRDVIALQRLLRALERTLIDALEHAEDVGFALRPDRSDLDVPSVAEHPQNEYRRGFYPIIRVMADLWERLAALEPEEARKLSDIWGQGPSLLLRRLAIFAATCRVHPAADLAHAVLTLNDHDFWMSGAQVEVMRGLRARWDEFAPDARADIEQRLNAGIPRTLFDDEAIHAERWQSIVDSATYTKLTRLGTDDHPLGADSVALLKQIGQRHPTWRPSTSDRTDFPVWSETSQGPVGDVDLLKDVPEAALVKEAARIARERQFDHADIWRLFCSSDPERAFTGLLEEANANRWDAKAWRELLWAVRKLQDDILKVRVADALLDMPDEPLSEFTNTVAGWIQNERTFFEVQHLYGMSRLWLLWDRLAELVYADDTGADESDEDVVERALNSPGGSLASTLIDHLGTTARCAGGGLGDLERRYTLVANAEGGAGLLGRVHFARELNYLFQIAPDWTTAELLPRFNADHVEALALWNANADARLGPVRLFNALKAPHLDMLRHPELPEQAADNLLYRLLDVLVTQQLGRSEDYRLTAGEVRDLLAAGPSRLREHFAWLLWRLQSDDATEQDELASKEARWSELVGPIFKDTWPLDARLRTEEASKNLVLMVMDCDDAFPEAVAAVVDRLGPYELFSIEYDFQFDTNPAALIERFPADVIELANAVIDPRVYPVPRDLGRLLDDCRTSDSQVVHGPAFLRLDGFRRRSSA